MKPELLAEREKGLGGSDVAPILGLSPWKTAYQVWEDKVGLSLGEREDTPAMAYGRMMEPVLRQWYSNETGRAVAVPASVLVHPEFPFIIGLVDGCTNDERVLEIKTARSSKDWGEPGTDEIPVYYTTQVQHYLMLTGYEVADVVVSFAGAMPVIYEVPADLELQAMILDEERAFWKLVEDRIPPEPVSLADMLSMFGRVSKAATVVASEEVYKAFMRLKGLKQQKDSIEEEEAQHKAIIFKAMGENDTLLNVEGGILATWKLSKVAEKFDTKAFEAAYPELYKQFLKAGTPSRRFLPK